MQTQDNPSPPALLQDDHVGLAKAALEHARENDPQTAHAILGILQQEYPTFTETGTGLTTAKNMVEIASRLIARAKREPNNLHVLELLIELLTSQRKQIHTSLKASLQRTHPIPN